jgi:hypothetical protein
MTWKDDLNEYNLSDDSNLDDAALADQAPGNKDIGLINQANGAGFLIRKDQTMQGFSDYGLGFSFDPRTKSLSVYAQTINLYTQKINKSSTQNLTFFQGDYKDVMDMVEQKEALSQQDQESDDENLEDGEGFYGELQ